MICVKSSQQGQLFSTPFEQELDQKNRWVQFSNIIPWDKLSKLYYSRMHTTMGA